MDNHPVSCKSLETYFHVNGKQLEYQYVNYLSDFLSWDQLTHASDWVLFEENIGSHLSLGEISLSQGELYTIITNKAAKGRKGSLVVMVKGTESERINLILKQIPEQTRAKAT